MRPNAYRPEVEACMELQIRAGKNWDEKCKWQCLMEMIVKIITSMELGCVGVLDWTKAGICD